MYRVQGFPLFFKSYDGNGIIFNEFKIDWIFSVNTSECSVLFIFPLMGGGRCKGDDQLCKSEPSGNGV